MRLKLRASMGLVSLRSSEGGSKKGLLGQLWEEGAAGKRDFLQSEPDMSELVTAFVQTFPAGAGKEAIRKCLGGAADEAHALLLMLCHLSLQ